jgi:non-ribosomal peptide synthetase component F
VQEAQPYRVKQDGIEISPLTTGTVSTVARYELTFNFRETPEGLLGSVEYSSDLFSQETVDNLLAQYVLLLEQIGDDPERRVDEYELATSWDKSLQFDWQLEVPELSRDTP